MNSSASVNDQALILIVSELAALIGAYSIVHKEELEEYGDKIVELASNITTHDVPALLKLAIKQNKGDR